MRAPFLFLLSLAACAPEREPPRSWTEREPPEASPDVPPEAPEAAPEARPLAAPLGPCEDGEVTGCKVELPTHGDVVHCAVGERVCRDGEWGPCEAILSDPT